MHVYLEYILSDGTVIPNMAVPGSTLLDTANELGNSLASFIKDNPHVTVTEVRLRVTEEVQQRKWFDRPLAPLG